MGKLFNLTKKSGQVLDAYKEMVENFDDILFILDEELNIVALSNMAKKLFLEQAGEENTRQATISNLFENIEDSWNTEWKGNHYRRYTSKIRKGNKLYGYFVFFADDTIMHNALTAITREKVDYRDANSSKTNFLMKLSQEIRNPMNAINGYSELIMKERDDDRRQRYAEAIKDASGNLLAVLNAVLDITKFETGEMKRSDTEYEMSMLLKRVIESVPTAVKGKDIHFDCNIDAAIPERVYGDCTLIRKIMVNILNDAIKGIEAGSVSFSLKGEYEESRDYIRFIWKIVSTGHLVSAKVYEQIFNTDNFVDSNKKYSEGVELGIVAAKAMIDILDGNASFVERPGKGTETTIIIRQKVLDREAIHSDCIDTLTGNVKDIKEVVFNSARVMIVDDNRINLEVLGQFMQQFGIKPVLVSSGKESIERAKKEDFDIIFMDHLMPEMDGVEAMHHIRDISEKHKKAVIIALTANVLNGAREMLISEGFTEYVAKPISLGKLKSLLLKYISEDRSEEVQKKTLIDKNYAVENYGYDDETFYMMLGIIRENFPKDLERLETYLKEGDIKNYVITVHSLKSNAKSIGALDAAELALKLEMAGKQDDVEELKKSTGALLEIYKELLEEIGKMVK